MVIYFAGNIKFRNTAEFEFKAPKRIARKYRMEDALAERIQIASENRGGGKRINIQNGKVNTNPKILSNPPNISSVKKASKIGSFLNKNKIGLGLGAGVVAGGLIANQIRKSRAKKNFLNNFVK